VRRSDAKHKTEVEAENIACEGKVVGLLIGKKYILL